MGWLSDIFKPQKAGAEPPREAQVSEFGLDGLIAALEKKSQEKNLVFEKDLGELHRKMLGSMREFSKTLSDLNAARGPDKIDDRLMMAAKSYASSMDKAFNAARTDFERRAGYMLGDFDSYFKRCASSVGRAESDVAKYVAPLKEVFPREMRNVLKKSKSMSGVLTDVRSSLEKKLEEAAPLLGALSAAKSLKSHSEKLSGLGLQVSEAKSNLANLESRKQELERAMSDFLRGDQWAEHQLKLSQLSVLEKKRDEIRTFIVQSIVPIDRAAKKLKKIRADLGKRIDDEEIFDMYTTDPLEAFLRDAGQKVLNRTVLQIKDIFEKISPDSGNRKDQKIMDSILFLESGETMRKARRDYDDVEEAIGRIRAEINVLGARESRVKLDEDLKTIVSKIPEARTSLEKLESLYSKMLGRKSEMFEGMESSARRFLGEQIRIQPLN